MSGSDLLTPLYNLSLVLNETGLKPDVLRAWERRYNLPKPVRSSGGHRLYSRQDIETVKWLQARQAEGMSIKRATDLWKELGSAGQDPIKEYKPGVTFIPDYPPVEGMQMDILRSKWLEACLVYDRHRADVILNEAFAVFPIERVCVEILQQGLSEIGVRWYHGSVTVQQEHFVSAQVMRRVEVLNNATPDPTHEQTILVGCPPGELHTYPSLFLSLMLRWKGYKVIDLGADVPLDKLNPTITAIQPDLVVMVAQQLTTAASILTVASLLKGWEINLAYGGLIFNRIPYLCTRIPAHFLGENLVDALAMIESLLTGAQNPPVIQGIADSWQTLAIRYQESRPRMESIIFADMQKLDLPIGQISELNAYLGDRVNAALAFGKPDLIEPDLEWLRGLNSIRKLPSDLLTHYLDHYRQALQKEMGEVCEPIVRSMETHVTK
jgi:MerR family transcriptional regulator, light-induced transcriptional regulator